MAGRTDELDARSPVPLSRQDHGADHFAASPSSRVETLWIFDADFEDLLGDNAGWISEDRSGTLAIPNYWHKDTIRINGFEHLGDSTWWCGKYDACWRQPRGYGNNWFQLLWRAFPEVATQTSVGDTLLLEYDQRYAMEKAYDYGYVDLRSVATGDTWYTLHSFCNPGFMGTPGISQDWDGTDPGGPGHMTLDLSAFSGEAIDVRFRFESDGAYSSQDSYDNPPHHSVLDGAWQIDNIALRGGSPVTLIFFDDCESPGDNGWVHDGIPAHGQTGVTFWRGLYGTDIWTNRPFSCDEQSGWMYAAVDPLTSRMVDNENAWLLCPPIDIAGAERLVGLWSMWVDLPRNTEDIFNIALRAGDDLECVGWWEDPWGDPGWWYGGPFWGTWTDDWDAFAGNNWLQVLWVALNDEPPEPGIEHMGGIFLNRQRVGIPTGDAGTVWETDTWNRFNDWYIEQMTDALLDTMYIGAKDDDGIASVTLLASNDGGQSWSSYTCRHESEQSRWWYAPPPSNEMTQGSEIWYYFEALDMVSNTAVYPSDAPDHYLEMSILPINASVSNPGVLLVDKHGRVTPGAQRFRGAYPITRPLIKNHSEYYYVEMLEILGYEWDTYDVDVPSGSQQSEGPDTIAYKYYDTQIWFFNEFNAYLLWAVDQENLMTWLNQSGEGKERNLLLTGNDVGFELMETGKETLSFYETWLASEYLGDAVGVVTEDSVPGLRERPGGWTFMDFDDGEAILRGGCPILNNFDRVQPYAGIAGTELVADYVKLDTNTEPAGVAYTHQTLDYQTVNLGFGMEFMMDGTGAGGSANYTPEGYYHTGVEDRVNLLANIMGYFGQVPSGDPTGVVTGVKNELTHAYPNPFNPVTRIAYSVKEAGPVTIEVYNVAGKVVRTLLDTELDAGSKGFVVWDGTSEAGDRCASGVYFYRIAAPGFTESHKMIMLK
ncbi:MAG: T9SS type A sorting domain-containing protein [Gemmatimonadota bacterium]